MIENTYRKQLESVDKTWVSKSVIQTRLNDFVPTGANKYQVLVDEVPFECLYIKNSTYNGKNLFVSLGGGGRQHKTYPCFFRWKYLNYLKGNYLAIDDPSYWKYPENKDVCWYYGDDGEEYYLKILKILERCKLEFDLSNENIFFFGSSGGGTASIKLANLLTGSTAIAFSPQFKFATWNANITEEFLQKGINLRDTEKNGLNADCINPGSRYFIVENLASRRDFESQYKYFAKVHNYIPEIGIYKIANNIWAWNHFSPSEPFPPHSANPEKLELQMIQAVLDGDVDVTQKIGEKSLGWYFSEILSDKWIAHSKYLILQNEHNTSLNDLSSINYLLKLSNSISNHFGFISSIKREQLRPRVKLSVDKWPASRFYEVSEIQKKYYIRLIIKKPTLKDIEILRKIGAETRFKFVDKNESEKFIYLREEVDPYSPREIIENFLLKTYSVFN